MKFLNKDEDGKFVVLTIPIEKNPSYGTGAAKGCFAIIKESLELEYYDEEFNNSPVEKGIQTVNLENLEEVTDFVKNTDKFVIALGGDHSIGIGILNGLEDFSVLQLDAHPDLFYSWNGSEENHRCFGRKALGSANSLVQVGIRAMDKDEKELIDSEDKILSITAREFNKNSVKKILDKLSDTVYISIDVDVFDPSFIRKTGTPEPGGLYWQEVIDLLKEVFKHKNVIIADINEFTGDSRVESYSLSKLAYKLMAMKQTSWQKNL
jgi:agmatinase